MARRGRGMAAALRPGPLTAGGRRREGLGTHAREALAAARDRAAQGDHAQAAEQFGQLAERQAERGEHGVAMHMHFEAARALVAAGKPEDAVKAGLSGATAGLQAQIRQKTGRKLGALATALREAGHADQAEALASEAKERGIGSLPAEVERPTINRSMRRALPRTCPGCGLPIDAETLELSDEALVDCGACGSPVTA